jgi:alanine dehydrogenase
MQIAQRGLHAAAALDPGLANAVNMYDGKLTNQAVADTFGIPYTAYEPVEAARQTPVVDRAASRTAF